MDLKQLKYFKTIVDEGSISKAAERLDMAQPPLSQQLKKLESELGTVLIKRYTEQWEVTETGKTLYNHAVRMLQDTKGIIQEIKEMESGTRGTLNIGVSSSCVHLLPENIRKFRELYPNIFINVYKDDSSYLKKLLVEREIELSFMLRPNSYQDFYVKCLSSDPFVLVIPKGWKNKFPTPIVSLEDIIDYPFLLLGPMEGYTAYETILDEFHNQQFAPQIVMECTDMSTLLSFVAAEVGISIMPKSETYGSFRNDVETRIIKNFSIFVQPAILYHKHYRLSKTAEQFLTFYEASKTPQW